MKNKTGSLKVGSGMMVVVGIFTITLLGNSCSNSPSDNSSDGKNAQIEVPPDSVKTTSAIDGLPLNSDGKEDLVKNKTDLSTPKDKEAIVTKPKIRSSPETAGSKGTGSAKANDAIIPGKAPASTIAKNETPPPAKEVVIVPESGNALAPKPKAAEIPPKPVEAKLVNIPKTEVPAQPDIGKSENRSPSKSGGWVAPSSANNLVNPLAGNPSATVAGKTLYKQFCAICHGDKGKGNGLAGMSLKPRPANFTKADVQKQTDGAIYWKINEGKTPMASYKTTLTEEQRWQLVNYIRTFNK